MTTDHETQFRQILTRSSQSATKARLYIFGLLLGGQPQSMKQLIEKAAGEVDRVSIYRNIELFERLGIVKKVYIGWKYKVELSDMFTSHHHHLLCLGCGKVVDIEDEKHIESFIEGVAKEQGFTVRSHQFEIEGYCQDCSKN
jgi:Fur family transcriptional regulator, ferric uptake regulator